MRSMIRLVTLLAMVPLVLTAVSCPEAEILQNANGAVTVVVRGANLGATRYETLAFNLAEVKIRPQDPAADASLGPNPIGLVAGLNLPVAVDLTRTTEVTSGKIRAGRYRVVGVSMNGMLMTDSNPPAVPSTCLDNFGVLPPAYIQPALVAFTITDSPEFEVTTAGGTLTITVDGPQFVAAMESVMSCRSAGFCLVGEQPFPAPCISGFDDAQFLTLSFMSFN